MLDEPTALPDGSVLHLVLEDEGDTLDPAERAALRAAIREGLAEADGGSVVTAQEFLAELRRKRSA